MILRSQPIVVVAALAVASILALSACASPDPTSVPSASPSGPAPARTAPNATVSEAPDTVSFALRTFPWRGSQDGSPVACDAVGIEDPVFGHLAGALPITAPDPIWLEAPDGTHLSIVWPEGFTLEFEPTPVIYDETGAVVARLGDAVMPQVSRHDAAGTYEDPYFASGILLAGSFTPDDLSSGIAYQGCFPRIPDVGPAAWWVDPTAGSLSPATTKVQALLIEQACASGHSPEGRILEPVIDYGADAVVVTISVTHRIGGQDCQGNGPFPIEITLTEPLGERALLDGGSSPPRDANTVP